MGIGQKLIQVVPFLGRHLIAKQTKPYQRFLEYLSARSDIWPTSQGEYIAWWKQRAQSTIEVTVIDQECHLSCNLENGVIEQITIDAHGGERDFVDVTSVPCPGTTFQGPVWVTVNSSMPKKELLVELLKREGILNTRIAAPTGSAAQDAVVLTQADVGPLLDEVERKMLQGWGKSFEEQVSALRRIVQDKLSAHHLPLFRVWYHPRLSGRVIRAVFTPRFDIDRAMTNLPRIRSIETKFGVTSTAYIRLDCPFYSTQSVRDLAARSWCPELALHGEFITRAAKYGDEASAALGDKRQLEALIGHQITGVSMHGGEMAFNRSLNTSRAIQDAGLDYDTTVGPTTYCFPFRTVIDDPTDPDGGQTDTVQISSYYVFPHALSDVVVLPFAPTRTHVNGRVVKSYQLGKMLREVQEGSLWRHNRTLYEKAVETMDVVYRQNGVFVLVLHPSYFGFLSYLARPRNILRILSFVCQYLTERASKPAGLAPPSGPRSSDVSVG